MYFLYYHFKELLECQNFTIHSLYLYNLFHKMKHCPLTSCFFFWKYYSAGLSSDKCCGTHRCFLELNTTSRIDLEYLSRCPCLDGWVDWLDLAHSEGKGLDSMLCEERAFQLKGCNWLPVLMLSVRFANQGPLSSFKTLVVTRTKEAADSRSW